MKYANQEENKLTFCWLPLSILVSLSLSFYCFIAYSICVCICMGKTTLSYGRRTSMNKTPWERTKTLSFLHIIFAVILNPTMQFHSWQNECDVSLAGREGREIEILNMNGIYNMVTSFQTCVCEWISFYICMYKVACRICT